MSDTKVEEEAPEALQWLFDMLDCHDRLLDREHQMRLFRLAVEKQMHGRQHCWTQKERLYMALTDCELTSPEERCDLALWSSYTLRLAELKDINKQVAIRTEHLQRTSTMDSDIDDIREHLYEKACNMAIDHFACAVPLSIATAKNPSVVLDDNAGCCPICRNSYTALSTSNVDTDTEDDSRMEELLDLLADFPVRIKYCGHIIGKACLEQWMVIPKLDEHKYDNRTCPMCRVEIEGVDAPEMPQGLRKHLRKDAGAVETARELMQGYDVDLDECFYLILACMSEEIACEELLAAIGDTDKDADVLRAQLANLREEKWAWGFSDDGLWMQLRAEWMGSGVGAASEGTGNSG
ncbi:hypothetical protein BDW02DRAFT_569384 [Decorospora gaudefroyi]|uniref:RING-type domain-containing protein n=1 Tax=Decorospora gaudefroyi TaxID=184978 RepID=A0A6A5K9U2_9PLEO|nr:hypothetical protein BDW02DRAFT_569384 [Decorospora gaudefroyi]